MRKTVFILGAGASFQAGAPLMSNFLDVADELLRQKAQIIADSSHSFENVFAAISELQTVYAKSYLDLDNIESLFGAVEMGNMLGKFGTRSPDKVTELRSSLVTLIYKTLEATMRYPVSNYTIGFPQPYGQFLESVVKDGRNHYRQPLPVAFITFNYDLALDWTLLQLNVRYSYYLNQPVHSEGVPLLKLHGSLNWCECKKCNTIAPFDLSKIKRDRVAEERYTLLPISQYFQHNSHCDSKLTPPPVLIPPSWNKTDYHGQLAAVWRRAAIELQSAENIFVIGFSLPETDSFFRYLYALGSDGPTRIKKFWVFDPDSSGSVKARYEKLIGQMVAARFKYHQCTFEDAIPIIVDALD
jgi:hypothetical protein